MERITGGCVTFWDQEKIRRIGAFPLHSHIAGPWYWNFADCDAKPMMDGERIYAYGRHTGNPALCALGAAMGTPIIPRDTPQMNRVLDALFRALAPCPYPEAEKQVSLPRLQVFARQWGTLYVACKGGHNGENHNHNDVGTFLLFHRGEPVIVDAGNMVYTAKTFSQERYTPVSYTHLDVYKRQCQALLQFCSFYRLGSNLYADDVLYTCRENSVTRYYDGLNPVSYTHLSIPPFSASCTLSPMKSMAAVFPPSRLMASVQPMLYRISAHCISVAPLEWDLRPSTSSPT